MMACLSCSPTVSIPRDRVKLEMHSEAVMQRVWRPYSSKFGDTFGGCDRANFEMHLEAAIV